MFQFFHRTTTIYKVTVKTPLIQTHETTPTPYSPTHPSVFFEPTTIQLAKSIQSVYTPTPVQPAINNLACLSQYLPSSSTMDISSSHHTTTTFTATVLSPSSTTFINNIPHSTSTANYPRTSTPQLEEPLSPEISSPVRRIIDNQKIMDKEDLRPQLMDFDQLGNITFMDDNMNNNNNINNNHQMKLNHNLVADNDVTCNNCKQNSINQQVLDAINELKDT